jgi:DNA-binding MarR family transcriptional regulator
MIPATDEGFRSAPLTSRDTLAEDPQPRTAPPRASEPGMVAWRSFLQAHAAIIRRLDAELDADQAVSLADFDVLAQLARAPGHRLRMSELADRALLSRSGMTRRVDRLESAGMVSREGCASDRRGAFAVLTTIGMQQLREARPTHVRGIDRHFLDLLAPEELSCISTVMGRLAARATGATGLAGADCEPVAAAPPESSRPADERSPRGH